MSDTLLILWPAALAGLLVLGSHVALGRQVLSRGIIFIDLAVAQAAATGTLASLLLVHDTPLWLQQLCAISAAGLMAAALNLLEKVAADIQEALIGASFVVLASLAVLLVSHDPRGGEHLHNLLSGQILWVDTTQLWLLAGASAIAMAGMLLARRPLFAFYLPLAIAVTAAVQAVGVYLVFASLIFPALAIRKLHGRGGWYRGMLCGVLGYIGGLLASMQWDLPSGPAVVVALALSALLFGYRYRGNTSP